MGILEEDVARVRESTDLVNVASEHMALRKVGLEWTGLCPFHSERSPSFSLNADQGVFYCFGCGAKGDAISFVRDIEHLDFVEAVEKLAAKAGITLRYDDSQGDRDHQKRSKLYDIVALAVEWYHHRLLEGRDAAGARAYLRSRGYDGELVRRYQLGWAPDGFDHLVKALRAERGATEASLVEAGLAFRNKAARLNDSFRGRVLFPIFEPSGRAIGFGGRVIAGGPGPKYKNTSETAIYSKSRTLYGLNWAKDAVVRGGQVVVCEGYTDVIAAQRVGINEAVATCGTALAEGHVRVLSNFGRRIVLAYDADAAGQNAAERYYSWETAFEVDISVAALPSGADPADLAASDPDALRQAITEARPYLAFRLDRMFSRADLLSPEGRARAAGAAMGLVTEHPSSLVRDQYLMLVADRCQVDPARLRAGEWTAPVERGRGGRQTRSSTSGDEVSNRSGSGGDSRSESAPSSRSGSGFNSRQGGSADGGGLRPDERSGPELEALRLAVHRPAEVADRLEEALFAVELHREVFSALADADTFHDALANVSDPASELMFRLAVEDPTAEADDVIVRMVERAGARAWADLERSSRQAEDPAAYGPIVGWLKLALEDLRDAERARSAEERLVPWLVEQARTA